MLIGFKKLQEMLARNFGNIYQTYPDASKVLDEYFRCIILGREQQAFAISDKLVVRNVFLSFSYYIYKAYLTLPLRRQKSIYCSLPKSPDLLLSLRAWAKNNGYCLIEEASPKKIHLIKSFFLRDRVSVRKSYVFSSKLIEYLNCIFQQIMKSEEIYESDIAGLDAEAKAQKCWFSKFLKTNNVKVLLIDNDQSATCQLLVDAARSSGIKSIVFAHGYIQDPYFVSILPLNANFLCVWSEGQKKLVLESHNEADRLVYSFGYPNYENGKFRVENNCARKVLLVSEPLLYSDDFSFLIFSSVINKLNKLGFEVYVRLHPKQRGDRNILSRLPSCLVDASFRSLEDCLKEVCLLIGNNSSLIFEAPVLGVPSVQISELRKYDFENAIVISYESIDEKFVEDVVSRFSEHEKLSVSTMSDRVDHLLNLVL